MMYVKRDRAKQQNGQQAQGSASSPQHQSSSSNHHHHSGSEGGGGVGFSFPRMSLPSLGLGDRSKKGGAPKGSSRHKRVLSVDQAYAFDGDAEDCATGGSRRKNQLGQSAHGTPPYHRQMSQSGQPQGSPPQPQESPPQPQRPLPLPQCPPPLPQGAPAQPLLDETLQKIIPEKFQQQMLQQSLQHSDHSLLQNAASPGTLHGASRLRSVSFGSSKQPLAQELHLQQQMVLMHQQQSHLHQLRSSSLSAFNSIAEEEAAAQPGSNGTVPVPGQILRGGSLGAASGASLLRGASGNSPGSFFKMSDESLHHGSPRRAPRGPRARRLSLTEGEMALLAAGALGVGSADHQAFSLQQQQQWQAAGGTGGYKPGTRPGSRSSPSPASPANQVVMKSGVPQHGLQSASSDSPDRLAWAGSPNCPPPYASTRPYSQNAADSVRLNDSLPPTQPRHRRRQSEADVALLNPLEAWDKKQQNQQHQQQAVSQRLPSAGLGVSGHVPNNPGTGNWGTGVKRSLGLGTSLPGSPTAPDSPGHPAVRSHGLPRVSKPSIYGSGSKSGRHSGPVPLAAPSSQELGGRAGSLGSGSPSAAPHLMGPGGMVPTPPTGPRAPGRHRRIRSEGFMDFSFDAGLASLAKLTQPVPATGWMVADLLSRGDDDRMCAVAEATEEASGNASGADNDAEMPEAEEHITMKPRSATVGSSATREYPPSASGDRVSQVRAMMGGAAGRGAFVGPVAASPLSAQSNSGSEFWAAPSSMGEGGTLRGTSPQASFQKSGSPKTLPALPMGAPTTAGPRPSRPTVPHLADPVARSSSSSPLSNEGHMQSSPLGAASSAGGPYSHVGMQGVGTVSLGPTISAPQPRVGLPGGSPASGNSPRGMPSPVGPNPYGGSKRSGSSKGGSVDWGSPLGMHESALSKTWGGHGGTGGSGPIEIGGVTISPLQSLSPGSNFSGELHLANARGALGSGSVDSPIHEAGAGARASAQMGTSLSMNALKAQLVSLHIAHAISGGNSPQLHSPAFCSPRGHSPNSGYSSPFSGVSPRNPMMQTKGDLSPSATGNLSQLSSPGYMMVDKEILWELQNFQAKVGTPLATPTHSPRPGSLVSPSVSLSLRAPLRTPNVSDYYSSAKFRDDVDMEEAPEDEEQLQQAGPQDAGLPQEQLPHGGFEGAGLALGHNDQQSGQQSLGDPGLGHAGGTPGLMLRPPGPVVGPVAPLQFLQLEHRSQPLQEVLESDHEGSYQSRADSATSAASAATSAPVPAGAVPEGSVPKVVPGRGTQGATATAQVSGPAGERKPSNANVLEKPFVSIHEKYRLSSKELGRGNFGVIRVCESWESGERFACKTIEKKTLECWEDVEDVQREVQVMKELKGHPNIIGLVDTMEDSNAVHLVMELCEGGELFDRIQAKGFYTESKAAHVCRTMVEVLGHCHTRGILHRDLKPENILLCSKKSDTRIKVIDYGMAYIFKPGERCTFRAGTPNYIAPEVINKNYGPEADIWSAGVILYIMLCGLPPFWGDTTEEIFKSVLWGHLDFETEPWPQVSNAAKDLVRRMLHKNYAKRITVEEILRHPWIVAYTGQG